MKILITGGCGFIGHHIVEHFLKNTDYEIVIIDKLSYAAMKYDRLRDINVFPEKQERVKIFPVDLQFGIQPGVQEEIGCVDYILHLCAESHVDHSIEKPVKFILNNVKSTLNILEFARKQVKLKMFVNFSTDEVYGTAPNGHFFKEKDYHSPSNPYSASKSAQEKIGIAYSNTYELPIITTKCVNVFGERQHFEKYVPMIIRKILLNETIFVHTDITEKTLGARFYIHARNVAAAVHHIMNLGYKGYDEWNISSMVEKNNLEIVELISKIIGKCANFCISYPGNRPGHDLRYALNIDKLLSTGFIFPRQFEETLEKTVKWSIKENNLKWLGINNLNQ